MNINNIQKLNYHISKVVRKVIGVYHILLARLSNKRFYCNSLSGKSYFCINSDMSISCNCLDNDGSGHLGNLNEQSIEEIFNSAKVNSFRKTLSEGKLPIATCSRCYELQWVDKDNAEHYLHNFSLSHKSIYLENTVVCNLKCLSCSREYVTKTRKKLKLSVNDLDKISSIVNKYKIKKVDFFNLGEPFTSNTISEEISILREKNPDVHITVSSNGVLLNTDEKRRAALKLNHIFFSIDGSTEDTYLKYRKNGSFEKAYQNMKDLVSLRNSLNLKTPLIEWQYIVFNWNDKEEHIRKAIELAKDADVDRLRFLPTRSPIYGISLRYYICNYFKEIPPSPYRKGQRLIEFR